MSHIEIAIQKWLNSLTAESIPIGRLLNSNQIILSQHVDLREEERLSFAFSLLLGKRNLVIEMPNPSTRLTAGVTAGLLVSDFIAERHRRRVLTGDVLFITRHIGSGLKSLEGVSLKKVAIKDIWEIKSSSQAVEVKGRGRPRLFVSPPREGQLLPDGVHLTATVIDASHPLTLERLATLLSNNPVADSDIKVLVIPLGYDCREHIDNTWLHWVWDWDTINQVQRFAQASNREPAKVKWNRTLLVCDDSELDSLLAEARETLGILSKHTPYPPVELLRAWGVYHRLSSLSVPLGQYEDAAHHHPYARPLRQTIEFLHTATPSDHLTGSSHTVWASEWRKLTESLCQAYEHLKGDHPAKFWGLAYSLERRFEAGFSTPLAVIVPTDIEGSILLRNLRHLLPDLPRYLHPDGLSMVKPKSFAGNPALLHRSGDTLLLNPLTSRWRYLNATILDAALLVYPHQVGLARYAVETIIRDVLERASYEAQVKTLTRLHATKSLSQIQQTTPLDEHKAISRIRVDIEDMEGIPQRETSESTLTVELSPSWVWDEEAITFVPPLQIGRRKSEDNMEYDSNSITLFLSDGTSITTSPDQTFDVFRFVTEELVEIDAAQIEQDDILVIIDDGYYANLFERSVEALETSIPQYARLSTWFSLWEFAKTDALEACDGSYLELHQQLTKKGISITEQAVRSWYAGIMAPREENALFAMIDLSGNKAAQSHKKQIRDSIGHIRGMRRAVGRRIQRLIKHSTVEPGIASGLADEIDIAVEDVLAAAKYVTVEHIQHNMMDQ